MAACILISPHAHGRRARPPGGIKFTGGRLSAMALRTTVLWIHALAGGGWVAACGCFVIAGLAIAAGSEEQRSFAMRAAPAIDRFNLAAAAILLITGLANFTLAGLARGFRFSAQFKIILSIKVMLFVGMAIALGHSLRIAAAMRAGAPTDGDPVARGVDRMVRAHGAIVAMGAAALLLGLWLLGS
jgi:hypothetical protein